MGVIGSTTSQAQSFGVGVGAGATDYEAFKRTAAAADEGGFTFISVGDNPGHLKDTYVTLGVAAEATESCWIGTSVTNPIHRDPLVVASALSSVESLAPGRVFLGIATGRARKPASLNQLQEHVSVLRSLWTTGKADYRGEELHLVWDAKPVPIMVCVSGLRGLRLAGQIGDAVLIESGVSPATVDEARGLIAEGARSVGRDPDGIELWWYLKTAIAESNEEAVEMALAPTAASGAFVLGPDPAAKNVPEQFHDACRELLARYDKMGHFRTGPDDPNRRLIPPGPFRDYLFDRFTLVGGPAEWIERIGDLKERGIDRVFCAAVVPDLERFVRLVGDEVLPKVGVSPA